MRSGFRLIIGTLLMFLVSFTVQAKTRPGDSHLHSDTESSTGVREKLKAAAFFHSGEFDSPNPTEAFKAPVVLSRPSNKFQGSLKLVADPVPGQIDIIVDSANRVSDPELEIHFLPPLDIELVQSGNDLIPVVRGARANTHPYWEWIIEPGKVWDEPGDGGFTRAVIPFSLQQRNANCTHNGLMSFLYRSGGPVSKLVYQVTSETCLYLQIDLWGKLQADYHPHVVKSANRVISAYRQEVANRLAVKPISELADDYPGVEPANFLPPSPDNTTVYGVVSDGVHYVGGCETRYGPHPFCAVLDLPSYSTSKSTFAGLSFMYGVRNFPGFADEKIVDWVPQCAQSGQWNDVAFKHAVNMTTGVYTSADYMEDEDAAAGTPFFSDETHAGKIEHSCTTHARQRSPGEFWVYHSSDSYVLGTAMNAYLKAMLDPQADIYLDTVVSEVWMMLGLSPVTGSSLRSYDTVAQPFTGYGLTYHPDDIARIAQFLNTDDGLIDGMPVFDEDEFEKAMQRGEHIPVDGLASRNLTYQNGFWAANTRSWIGCNQDTWVPFMSGFGGITVALFPNDTAYYVFSDSGIFQWATAANEANQIRPYCAD